MRVIRMLLPAWQIGISVGLVLSFMALGIPATAIAATPPPKAKALFGPTWCKQIGVVELDGDITAYGDSPQTLSEVYATGAVTPAPGRDAAALWTEARQQFSEAAREYSQCPPSADRDLSGAYLALWSSILQRHYGHEWRDDLNTSTQLFQKCVIRNYGSNAGGKCQSMVESNIKRKIAWDREDR
jgi:hypothetical protein